ncbi:MAG: transcriptional regulator [Pirellulaceae bacterium]|nr:transcriptional regulator [Pirellulaceae bacterium]
MNKAQKPQARDLDKVIHEKTRLDILTTLAAHPKGIQFTDLKTLNELTDGNLNRHLKVLADAELIQSKKANRGRNAKTTYSMTKRGLSAFETYLGQLEAVLQRAHQATTQTRNPTKRIAIE